MEKKYQVFISSTFEDLKEEREKVIEILLNKNCIPVGMEYFPAADDSQMTIIKHLIEECDYYILILGGRYGSLEPKSQKSYTHLEYDYAIEKGIPISAFYIENKDELPQKKVEQEHLEKMTEFENLVKRNRMCNSWKNADDLAGKVCISLDYQIKNHPRIGWVRANKVSSDEANGTILELKKENEQLKKQVSFLSSSVPQGTELYKQGNDIFIIHYESLINPFCDDDSQSKHFTIKKTWDEIFLSVCTVLLKPVTESVIKEQLERTFLSEYDNLEDIDFQTILIQLMALKLINTDVCKSKYDGIYTYWVLTSYGRERMVNLRAIKK